TMDVPSTSAGVVKSVAVNKGDRVSKDSLILTLEVSSGQRTADGEQKPAPDTAQAPQQSATPAPAESRAASQEAPAPATSAEVTVPDIGDFKDVEVIEVLVKAGDRIEVDTPLITLETEKATMDVP